MIIVKLALKKNCRRLSLIEATSLNPGPCTSTEEKRRQKLGDRAFLGLAERTGSHLLAGPKFLILDLTIKRSLERTKTVRRQSR